MQVVLPDETDAAELAARVAAHQELLDKFWADMAEQATEVPLPAHLVDVGFENMSLPKIELDTDLKRDGERMVGWVIICVETITFFMIAK